MALTRETTLYYLSKISLFFITLLSKISFKLNRISRILFNNKEVLKAELKRKERDYLIKKTLPKVQIITNKIPQKIKNQILISDVTNLLLMIENSFTNPLQIVAIYYERALTLGLEYELIADIIPWEDIMNQIKIIDKLPKKKENLLLKGIPISVKDVFILKGTDDTGGCAANCFQPAISNGLIIDMLLRQGAVPFIKTNIPQCLLVNESMCRIWGRAKNPWDKTRTPGGSSGGEAGLISLMGSPIGIGNDIGGSVRIPALYSGLYAFKPSSKRINWIGVGSLLKNTTDVSNINIRPVVGPIGKSVRDLILVFKSLINNEFWSGNPQVIPLEFNQSDMNLEKKLNIGLLFFIIFYYFLLFFIIFYYFLLFFIIFYYFLLFFIIFYYFLLFFIIFYYFLLFS